MRSGDWIRDRLGAEKPPNRALGRALNRGTWPAGAALIWLVLSLLAMYLIFSPAFTGWVLSSTGTGDPRGLLRGHLRCCQIIAAGMGIILAVHGGFALLQLAWVGKHILAVRRERRETQRADVKSQERMQQLGMEAVHAMAAVILLLGAAMSVCFTACFGYISASEGIWSCPGQVQSDLRQIEEGRLEEFEVWIAPESRPADLPGPYDSIKRPDRPATLYLAAGEATDYQWFRLYVPNTLGFSPDPERPMDKTRTVDWNREHARRYRVGYTSNLHLAISVEPVEH